MICRTNNKECGFLRESVRYSSGCGTIRRWDFAGNLLFESSYDKDNLAVGRHLSFYTNEILEADEFYEKGMKVGTHTHMHPCGAKKRVVTYDSETHLPVSSTSWYDPAPFTPPFRYHENTPAAVIEETMERCSDTNNRFEIRRYRPDGTLFCRMTVEPVKKDGSDDFEHCAVETIAYYGSRHQMSMQKQDDDNLVTYVNVETGEVVQDHVYND